MLIPRATATIRKKKSSYSSAMSRTVFRERGRRLGHPGGHHLHLAIGDVDDDVLGTHFEQTRDLLGGELLRAE